MFEVQPAPTPTPSPAATAVVTPTPAVEVSPSVVPTTGSPLPLPVDAVDGTPLLSTLVQSGAALVAIIAGLLIARLVALVGERNSLERRVRELAEVAAARRNEYAEAHRERLDDDGGDFIEHIFDHYFDDEHRTFESLYASYDDEPGDRDELRPYYARFVSQFEAVVERLNGQVDLFAEDRMNWTDEGERDRILHPFSGDLERRIAEKIVELAEDSWDKRRRNLTRGISYHEAVMLGGPSLASRRLAKLVGSLAVDPASVAVNRQISSTKYLQLRAVEASAKAAAENAERDLAHAREALANVSKPEGLVLAVVLLGAIAIAGVVLPLVQLTAGETVLSAAGRWVYTGFFLASLAAFFLYLGAEIVRLNKPPKVQ